ncbi:unnamed protein product [Miscanthus lutarioriparius]|uniref:Calmodulin-binding domain-containing protein n=1 Tax=Miscanthus lutarioriparius TaxID=422564 RepID=A0A811PWY3_9POAL|nr:unnamed protein product [Miscanthus lutarioriparius]
MAPSRSLPRSASELADPPSPFSSNPAHHPVSVPNTLGLSSCSSFGRMLSPPTDTPTKQQQQGGNKPKPTPAAAVAAYYASLWSPRRLMQRAARAFRRSRSRGRVRTVKDLAEERASVLNAGSSKVSDAAAVLPPAGAEVASGAAVGSVQDGPPQQQRHDDYHHEIVPEKIIREDAPPAPVVAEEKETASTEEEVESPKKGAAPVPEAIVAAAAMEDDVVADKFVTVVKEAIKKHEAEQDEKKEAMRRFQGSRVKTAMEARPESEQPRRREVARSNDVIEEARTKLLEKRQCSRVKALVGAFETVMDTKKDAAVAGKPQHQYRKSA